MKLWMKKEINKQWMKEKKRKIVNASRKYEANDVGRY